MKATVPFVKSSVVGNELEYVRQVIENGHTSGDGVWTKRCTELLTEALGGAKVLLTTSCTHALEMSALLLDLREGDEFIVPAFTFVTTANAFVLRGARPVFADIRPDTLNIDERLLEGLITPKTKAIVVVHYASVSCEMDAILETATHHSIPVVEDTAHALFGQYQGRTLGTMGSLGTLSFHETKNFSCGEGGALIINDPALYERAEMIREKGTNRSKFFRGQVDKYTWTDVGSSYLPSDILSAYLFAQIENRHRIMAVRETIWLRYRNELADWCLRNGVWMPSIPDGCELSHHMFQLLMPSLELRTAFIAHLRSLDIESVFHYLPLNRARFVQKMGWECSCPVTESVSDRIVRLPFFNSMTEQQQERVVSAVLEFQI